MATPFQQAKATLTANAAAFKALADAVRGAATAAADVVAALPGVKEFGEAVRNLVGSGLTAAARGFDALRDALRPFAAAAVTQVVRVFDALRPVISAGLRPIIEGFDALKTALAPVAAAVGRNLMPVLASLGTAAVATGAALLAGAKAFGAVAAAVGGMAGAVADWSRQASYMIRQPFQVLETAISSTQIEIARFVKLASPGTFQRFQLAVDDLYASIGRALIPVLEKATQIFRAIGSAIFGLSADGQLVIQAIAAGTVGLVAFGAAAFAVQAVLSGGIVPVLAALGGAIGGVMAVSGDLKPIMDRMADAFSGVMDTLGEALDAFTGSGALDALLGLLTDLFGTLASVAAAALKELAPGFAALAEVLSALAPVITPLVLGLSALVSLPVLGPVAVALVAVAKAFQFFGPAIEAAADVIGSTFKEFTGLLADVAQELWDAIGGGETWQQIKDAVSEFNAVMMALARVVGDVIKSIAGWVRDLLGVEARPEAEPGGRRADNTGAAARSVSTGSPEDVLRKAREQAFQLGTGATKPEVKTASEVALLRARADEIYLEMKGYIDGATQFPEKLQSWIANLPADLAEKLRAFVAANVPSLPSLPSAPNLADIADGLVRRGYDALPDVF